MEPKQPQDELARRRALREKLRRSDPPLASGEDDEPPRLTWSETWAMIIAAYQVVMPMVLISIAVVVAAYYLFMFIFH